MAIKILEIKQNSEEWLRARQGLVTGSNADNLLSRGLDEALKANYQRLRGNYYTQRGHILEDEALEIYAAIHECQIERPGLVRNDLYPNAACSPDGWHVDGELILLEVKAFNSRRHNEIVSVASTPFKIMAQLQFNMMICQAQRARLIMYNPDEPEEANCYREIEVKAVPSIHLNMARRLRDASLSR